MNSKLRTFSKFIVVIIIFGFFVGCASIPPNQEQREIVLDNPTKALWITVESVPSRANVYGSFNGSPGTLLGKTPLKFRYARTGGYYIGDFPEETLDLEWRADLPLRMGKAYMAFKCVLIKDGFRPYRMYQVLQNDTWWLIGLKHLKFAGKQRTFTAVLSPSP